MALGEATQEATYGKSIDETFADVQKALSMIGEVKNTDNTAFTVEGTSKYGLQSVKLKVKITSKGDNSLLSISGFSDDVWAAGAKNCMKRLIEALNNLGDVDFKPSRTGVKPVTMALTLVGFILLIVVIIIFLQNLPTWATIAVCIVGFSLLIYFVIARRRFSKK